MRFPRVLLAFVSVFLSASIKHRGASCEELTVACDVTLKDLSALSDFVFTAKVEALAASANQSHNGDKVATIDIKRLIRASNKTLFENASKESKVSVVLSSSLFFSDSFAGRELARKIGNCSRKSVYTNVKVRDTKIFCGRLIRDRKDARVRRFDVGRSGNDVPLELLAVSVQLNLETLEYFTFIEGES